MPRKFRNHPGELCFFDGDGWSDRELHDPILNDGDYEVALRQTRKSLKEAGVPDNMIDALWPEVPPVEQTLRDDVAKLATDHAAAALLRSEADYFKREWSEEEHPRHPAGTAEGGRFAPKDGGDVTVLAGGREATAEEQERVRAAQEARTKEGEQAAFIDYYRPGDRAKAEALRSQWAELNNDLLRYVDKPDSPVAQAKMQQMKQVVKDLQKLHVDTGTFKGTDIGKPGGPRDVVIVGAGPGGMSAAIAGGTEGLDTLLIEADIEPGGQAKHSSRIENYPGFPAGVRGEKLMKSMYEQTLRTGAETRLGTRVVGLSFDPATHIKTLTLSDGSKVDARSVILAAGLEFNRLKFPGSEGPGVIFGDGKKLAEEAKGGRAVVVGGSNGAAQAALGVVNAGAEHVTLLSRGPISEGMSAYQIDQVRNNRKITVLEGDQVKEIRRDKNGTPVSFETAGGKSLPIKAAGFFIGSSPQTNWLPPEIGRVTDKGPDRNKIVTGSDYQTAIPGVYAIGDVRQRDVVMGRVGLAVGEGQFALRNVFEYFNERKGGEASRSQNNARIAALEAELARLKAMQKRLSLAELDAAWDDLMDEAFDVDAEHPWFGQFVDPQYTDDIMADLLEKDIRGLIQRKYGKASPGWDETKHPRGHPSHPGRFAAKPDKEEPAQTAGKETPPSEAPKGKETPRKRKVDYRGDMSMKAGTLTQPVETLDELYERSRKAEPAFVKTIEDVAKATGGRAMFGRGPDGSTLKPRQSAERKVRDEYDGDATRLRDVLRATIAHDTVEETRMAAAQFIEEQGENILVVKDRFAVADSGYRDININFRTPDGLAAEIQFNSGALLRAKNGDGHKFYEQERLLVAEVKRRAEKLGTLDPDIGKLRAQILQLQNQQAQVYDAAYIQSGNGKWKQNAGNR